MPTPHDICIALRSYRIRARLRQQTIAQCLGVAQSQISRWESGRDVPRAHNADAIRRLIWGPENDPLASWVHFVSGSSQNLVLFAEDHTILARALPYQTSPNDLDRFGWVLDPERNPAFAPAYRRYRDLLSAPHGVIGLSIVMPFVMDGESWRASIRKTIQSVAGVAICLAELDFAPIADEADAAMVFEEFRLGVDGAPRQSTTQWR